MSFKDGNPVCPHHGFNARIEGDWYVCGSCGPYRRVRPGDGSEEE